MSRDLTCVPNREVSPPRSRPANLLPSSRSVPDDASNVVVTLPVPPANLTVDFARTTFLHWPQMSQNLTEQRGKDIVDGVEYKGVGGSYFLFKDADELNKTQVRLRSFEIN